FLGHLSLRFIGLLILAAVVGAGAAFVLLQRYVTSEWMRSVIVAQLQHTFQRPVEIRRVSVVLHQGLRVDGLVVGESPDFPGETFLSSDSLIIRYNLPALLAGRLELSLVRLISPRIELIRRADGRWNIQDMLTAPQAPKAPIALPPLQSADMILIEGGDLRVRDLKNRSDFSFSGLKTKIDLFHTESPFNAEISFCNNSAFGGRRIDAEVDFSGVISLAGLRKEEAYVAAKRLVVSVGSLPIEATGSLRNFVDPRLDIKVAAPRMTSGWLSGFGRVPEGIDIPPSFWKLKVRALTQKAPLAALLERPYEVELLEVGLDAAQATARGFVGSLRKLRMSASVRGLDLGRAAAYYLPWAARAPEGMLNGSISFGGTISSPTITSLSLALDSFGMNLSSGQGISNADISIRGEDQMQRILLSLKGATYIGFGQTLTDAALDSRIAGGDLDVRGFQAVWNKSRVGFKGCVHPLSELKQITGDATVDKLAVDKFYSGVLETIEQRRKAADQPRAERPWAQAFKYSIPRRFPDLRGRLRIAEASSPNFRTQNLELLLDLKGISQGLREASGNFRVGFGPGQVDNVPEVRASHKVLNVLLLPFTKMHEMSAKARMSPDTATPTTFVFNRNYGDFGAEKGVVDVRMLHSDGEQFVAFADGKVDFASEKIKARVMMRLTTQRGLLPERLSDAQGRASMELLLSGDLNKPDPELTLRKMGASDIEDALTEGMKRAVPLDPLAGAVNCGGGK
ncbi:MAG: hypothetical protein HY922_14525, partial [Elusimicrobia bacterium]|nr:hypothetical protein [Elusimicrobiota bacterium]